MRLESSANRLDAFSHKRAALGLGLCLAVGTALRVWGMHRRPLWVDEAFSLLYATVDWADVIEMRRAGTNPPLYHFLLSGWVELFGTSAATVRSLSAVFAIVSIGVLYQLARRLAGRTTALIAAALLAVANLSVAYAQEARFYALTQLLALVSSLFLYDLIERQRLRDAAGYVVSAAALLWTHTFGWFVLAAQVVWLLAARRAFAPADQRRRRISLLGLASVALVVLAFAPWVPVLLQQIGEVRRGYWISEPHWLTLADVARSMLLLDRVLRWPLVALAAIMILRGVIGRLWARSYQQATDSARRSAPAALRIRAPHVWGLAAWMTLPILVPFVWSKFSTPIFQVKYAIVAQAPALILFAMLLVRRPVVGVAVLALLTGIWPPNGDRGLIVEDWPQAARILTEDNTADATVFVYKDYAYFPLDYYLQDRRRIRPVYTEGQVSSCFTPYYPADAATFDDMMHHLAQSDEGEVWFVLRWGCPHERAQLHDRIAALRDIETMWKLRCVDVLRLVPRPDRERPTENHPAALDRAPTAGQ